MKRDECRKGLLVRNMKGNKRLGVVKKINGNQALVRFSKSGHDEEKEVSISDIENTSVTKEFYNDLVTFNS